MKRIFLIIFSLLFSWTVTAQVREVQIAANVNSIVRQLDDTTVLMYAEGGAPSVGSFLLYEDGDVSAQVLTLPTYMHVRDMRIWDKQYAYFCGYIDWIGSSTLAMVGCFDIAATSGGAGNIDWAYFSSSSPSSCPEPTAMRRLELFETGDTVCMAMVGDAIFGGDSITTVMSAHKTGSSSWMASVLIHKGDYKFTDLTVLRHLVVAVGTYAADTGCIVEPFRRTLYFPAQPLDPYWAHRFDFGSPVGEVLVAQEHGDIAVMAHYDQADGLRTVLQRTAFDTTTGVPTVLQALVVPPASTETYDAGKRLWELTVAGGDSYLLQRGCYPAWPGINDWRIKVSLPWSASVDGWRLFWEKAYSLDVTSARWVTTRENQLRLQGPQWMPGTEECYKHETISGTITFSVVQKPYFEPYSAVPNVNSWPFSITLSKVEVTEICK